MELFEIMFFVCFFGAMAITLYKLYNLLNGLNLYGFKESIMFFIGYLILYGVLLVTDLVHYDTTIIRVLFNFSTYFMPLNALFLIVEIIMLMVRSRESQMRKAYNAKDLLNYRV